jgi:hypothetical protein
MKFARIPEATCVSVPARVLLYGQTGKEMNMPTQGQRQGWKWLVGLGLVTVYGLIASPASFAQNNRKFCGEDYVIDCEERRKERSDCDEGKSRSDCDERRTEGGTVGSKCDMQNICRISEKPDVVVAFTVERMLIDCELDVLPEKLIIRSCHFMHEEEKDGGKVVTAFAVNVEDVDPTSIRLDICPRSDCAENLADFHAFQSNGLRPLSVDKCDTSCKEIVLNYNAKALLERGCGPCKRTLGVIGQLKKRAEAIPLKGETKTLPVGQAFIRGMEEVVCSP